MKSSKKLDWKLESKRILKAQLARKGITHEDLAKLLTDLGHPETKATVDNKISRGSFSFAFFLKCMWVLGIRELKLD